MKYQVPEIKEGDMSPELVSKLLKSDWNQPPIPRSPSRDAKIVIGSFIIADLTFSAFKGERPIIVSIIIWLFYVLITILGIYAVFKALKWFFESIGDLFLRGVKALCGI